MSTDEIEQGKKIIEKMIAEMSRERGVRFGGSVVWHYDFNRMAYWLEFEIEGQTKRWKFSREAIEDSVKDKTRRREIEKSSCHVRDPRPRRSVATNHG